MQSKRLREMSSAVPIASMTKWDSDSWNRSTENGREVDSVDVGIGFSLLDLGRRSRPVEEDGSAAR